VLQAELATLEPPMLADAGDAAAALANFGWFWDQETDPSERNKILRLIFEQVTVDDGRIVTVTPRDAFLPYFQFGQEGGVKSGSDGTRTRGLPPESACAARCHGTDPVSVPSRSLWRSARPRADTGCSASASCRGNAEDPPLPRHPFQRTHASIFELDTRTGNEVFHRGGHQHFSRPC
jgi:hypothetical protein